ncbi:peptide deformylase [Candidatus Neoehrlichia lotoris str. RAC413]|uniref:Peptide deformylase n=1 Tax=Candidatus Neoehrlichia procyonis str. RAC413 TaxID=1359163 RepID=A0A0F3NR04_9RICK|nr:peptide deformylase [Candidatus Neoehrlichia lotoris str. RAC413]
MCSETVADITNEIKKLIDDMFETMYAAKGLGLAAVQVGVHKRIFVADVPKDSIYYHHNERSSVTKDNVIGYEAAGGPFCVINPQILEMSEEKIVIKEGCLSVPEQAEEVSRPKNIIIKYTDYNGNDKIIKAQGLLARCLEHEIDHLNGIIFFKHLSKIKRDFIIEKAKRIKRMSTMN